MLDDYEFRSFDEAVKELETKNCYKCKFCEFTPVGSLYICSRKGVEVDLDSCCDEFRYSVHPVAIYEMLRDLYFNHDRKP